MTVADVKKALSPQRVPAGTRMKTVARWHVMSVTLACEGVVNPEVHVYAGHKRALAGARFWGRFSQTVEITGPHYYRVPWEGYQDLTESTID